MPDDSENRDIVKRQDPDPPVMHDPPVRSIRLGDKQELDLSNLSAREAEALEIKAHEKAIERDDRRQRLKEDLTVTAAQINTFTSAVRETSADDAAVTITNTKDDSLGRTEMIFGNTDFARKGKLTRAQEGFGDYAKIWILFAVIAGVVIVLVAALN
jgi:hypothetical protein